MDGTKILSILRMCGEPAFYRFTYRRLNVFLKACPNILTISAIRAFISTFTQARVWIVWDPISNPRIMGQILCQVRNEPNFWIGPRSKRTNFFVMRENSDKMTSMYRSSRVLLLGTCFWNWSKWTCFGNQLHFPQFPIKFSVQGFLNLTLWVLSQQGVTIWLTASVLKLFEGLKWLAYLGWSKNITHAGNGRKVH